MAIHSVIVIDPLEENVFGPLRMVTVSGTVLNNEDPPQPRVREILFYDEGFENETLKAPNYAGRTQSSPVDGSYSFTKSGTCNNVFRVIMVGGPNENDKIISHVKGV